MSTLQIIATSINVAAAIILICNGIGLWVDAGYLGGIRGYFVLTNYLAIPGIYCISFASFVVCSEIRKFDGFYNRHLGFYMRPLGRGIAYIFFSLMTFNVIWYGVLSFVLLLVFGIGSIILYFQLPEYKYEAMIGNGSLSSVEKNTGNSHLEAQTPNYPNTSQQVSMPEPAAYN